MQIASGVGWLKTIKIAVGTERNFNPFLPLLHSSRGEGKASFEAHICFGIAWIHIWLPFFALGHQITIICSSCTNLKFWDVLRSLLQNTKSLECRHCFLKPISVKRGLPYLSTAREAVCVKKPSPEPFWGMDLLSKIFSSQSRCLN